MTHAKQNGVHYTPPALAAFLASVTVQALHQGKGPLAILDPACGDGGLLLAITNALPAAVRHRLTLVGYETDPQALEGAKDLLADTGVKQVILRAEDFLSVEEVQSHGPERQRSLFGPDDVAIQRYDAVIANPPYVRTQVLGAKKAQMLAQQFGLSGRVDLYQAFTKAMAHVLKPGGVLGLLTSNRFLTVKSGASLRHLLRTEFELEAIYDLGDTKLFNAAVLPVIVVARKQRNGKTASCIFERVYEYRKKGGQVPVLTPAISVLDALRDRTTHGIIHTKEGTYNIERGVLSTSQDDEVWSLSTPTSVGWLESVQARQAGCFDDVAKVRVGIKTTADEVFIKDDWNTLPCELRPEQDVLRPLVTHYDAAPWLAIPTTKPKHVLYPHKVTEGKRRPINLADYPRAASYFQSHRKRLTSRTYVIEGGRQWYEIWVPHNPDQWAEDKIVFPDIAEYPRFFLDTTGAVVNGDCYWITLKPDVDPNWLFLMLAVANSTFITKYYDTVFHNKLYAGRRRFMTQYVKKFPLPDIDSKIAKQIIASVSRLVASSTRDPQCEARIDRLVWKAFGLPEEISWQGNL